MLTKNDWNIWKTMYIIQIVPGYSYGPTVNIEGNKY